jgi:hypothetical protein
MLLRTESATSCPRCSRLGALRMSCRCYSCPGSSTRASCPLCAMSLRLVFQRGDASPCRAGDVLPLLVPPWELRACFVPAVRDVLAFGRSAGQRFSAQIAQVPATSCHCCSRPGSSARASRLLCTMPLRLVAWHGRRSSAQIMRVVGEVLGWLLLPQKLHGGVVSAVRDVVVCGQPARRCRSAARRG